MTAALPHSPHLPGRRPLFGLELDALTMEEVLVVARDAITTHRRLLVGVVNAAKIVHMRKDAELRSSLLEADVLLADGQSVVWASRMLGRPLPERVAGCDLFERLLELADQEGRSVYLLGATPDTLERMLARIAERYPRLRIAGARDGYFRDDEAAAVADEIAESGADMLFLGITSPKKEIFLGTHGPKLGVPVLHGVGGSFDVLAGVTRRAPRGWQRLGIEWAYRLLQEPRRLGGRYLSTNTAFVALTVKERVHATMPYRLAGASTRASARAGSRSEG